MARGTILVVEDETDIVELVKHGLEREGFDVLTTTTGEEAIELARSREPDLIVLDLMLPNMDGLEVCKILKHNPKTAHVPIVMLSAKSEDADMVTGLELGAEDYVAKPFSTKVLIARIRRILTRKTERQLDRRMIKIHDLTIDPARCEAYLKDQRLSLTLSEFNILYTLASRAGIVFTRYQIIDLLHGSDYVITDRAVDVQVAYLRKKLGNKKDYVETVRGVAYRFKDALI